MLPIVAVAVPFIDVLLVLPVLVIMLIASGTLSWTVVLLLPLLVVQFVLMAGIAWLAAAANVFMRDIENVIGVGLTLVFYCTPIFYSIASVPERYQTLLRLNPMTTMVESYRGVLMGTEFPSARRLAVGDASAARCSRSRVARVPPRRAAIRGRAVSAPAVVLEGVWKSYPRYEPGARTLRGFVARRAPGARRPGAALGPPGRLAVGRAGRVRRGHRRQRRGQVDAPAPGLGARAGRRSGRVRAA